MTCGEWAAHCPWPGEWCWQGLQLTERVAAGREREEEMMVKQVFGGQSNSIAGKVFAFHMADGWSGSILVFHIVSQTRVWPQNKPKQTLEDVIWPWLAETSLCACGRIGGDRTGRHWLHILICGTNWPLCRSWGPFGSVGSCLPSTICLQVTLEDHY